MILVDFSQIIRSDLAEFEADIIEAQRLDRGMENIKGLVFKVCLSMLRSYKRMYSKKYGELIICCDSKNCWRLDSFPQYKHKRKANKEKSKVDWAFIYECVNELIEDLTNYFPYKVIKVDRTEGDDIIGVLTHYLNDIGGSGIFDEPEEILIISSDGDFKQLHYQNVRQWSPMHKKFVDRPKEGINKFLLDKIAAGDAGDGVPSIMNPDDIFTIEGSRQKSLFATKRELLVEKGVDGCDNDFERTNYERNKLMVDLKMVPEEYKKKIIQSYIACKPNKDKSLILSYLAAKKLPSLIQDIHDF